MRCPSGRLREGDGRVPIAGVRVNHGKGRDPGTREDYEAGITYRPVEEKYTALDATARSRIRIQAAADTNAATFLQPYVRSPDAIFDISPEDFAVQAKAFLDVHLVTLALLDELGTEPHEGR